jgi:microcystin degradation protein MlrC
MPRIAIAQLAQETNHFAPVPTTMADFVRHGLARGADLLTARAGSRTEIPGMLDVLARAGATPVPLLAAFAMAGGPVRQHVFDTLLAEIVQRLKDAGAVDGVLLALHGAMVTDRLDDPEAAAIAAVRGALPPGTPVGVSLDLHGHITPLMLQPDTHLIGYRCYPHTDMYETGARTAELLLDRIAGRRRPVMALAKRPMVPSPVVARTVDPPLNEVVAEADRLMAAGTVLHAALFPVQPWLDVPDLGFAALVCADGDQAAAQRAADRLADMAWDRRDRLEPDLTPLDQAIRIGLTSSGMTLVSDPADAPTSGSAADRPDVLRALLAAGADRHDRPILLTLNDAPAAAAAHAAGAGATLRAELGHSVSSGPRLPMAGTVLHVGDGRFAMQDSGATGLAVDQGPTAVLGIGAIRLVLRSLPGWEWDTAVYRSVGLEPAQAALVFVKSPSHFRVGFGPLAARVLTADTDGASVANMRRVAWKRITRPLWPVDPI